MTVAEALKIKEERVDEEAFGRMFLKHWLMLNGPDVEFEITRTRLEVLPYVMPFMIPVKDCKESHDFHGALATGLGIKMANHLSDLVNASDKKVQVALNFPTLRRCGFQDGNAKFVAAVRFKVVEK